MKKLMLIVPSLRQGGFQRVCVNTAHLLTPYCDVTVVVFDGADIAYNVDGLRILDIGLGVKKGRVAKLLNILRRAARLRKMKKSLKPEVAYSLGATANLANAFSKTKGTKVWLGLRSYMDMGEKAKLRLFTRLADLIICCSKTIEDELWEQYHFTKTATLYNPYDVERMVREAAAGEPELPWPDGGTCLVSMGREDDVKGFWHMLKVFALIREKIADVRLMILGDGSFSEYRRLAADLGIGGSVYFAGLQKQPYPYLKKGSVYLLTSLNEGFPNGLVEGMALGLAAVSVDCLTGPAEILLAEESRRGRQGAEPGAVQENAYEVSQCDVSQGNMRETMRRNGRWAAREATQGSGTVWGEYGILLPLMDGKKDLTAGHITPEEEMMATAVIRLLSDRGLLLKYQKAAAARALEFSHEEYVERLGGLLGEVNS